MAVEEHEYPFPAELQPSVLRFPGTQPLAYRGKLPLCVRVERWVAGGRRWQAEGWAARTKEPLG